MSIYSVIQEWADKPFAYGQDCCQFAGAVVKELTGSNPMDAFNYHNEATALRIIKEFGGLDKAMIATLGEPIPVDETEDGDVLLADGGYQLAGVRFKGTCVVKTRQGVTNWPLDRAKMGWSCRKL